ncbi:NAD(P)H-flavin reductase [Vibrio astriarenae]|nr:NAD(P)H-flavin reductase [Vibrio sp. C7]
MLHPDTPVLFKAGQYLTVVMGEKDKRPFSIASSPCRHEGELELHIGAAEHNAYAIEVVEAMQQA